MCKNPMIFPKNLNGLSPVKSDTLVIFCKLKIIRWGMAHIRILGAVVGLLMKWDGEILMASSGYRISISLSTRVLGLTMQWICNLVSGDSQRKLLKRLDKVLLMLDINIRQVQETPLMKCQRITIIYYHQLASWPERGWGTDILAPKSLMKNWITEQVFRNNHQA